MTKQDLRYARCPRCGGFLYSSEYKYWKFRKVFRDCLHCSSCGRDWRIEMVNGSYVLESFSYLVPNGVRSNSKILARR